MDAKEYYRTGKHSVWKLSEMRQDLITRILDDGADSVFEFGCGSGETLAILKESCITVGGMDINPAEVKLANSRHLERVVLGDETILSLVGDDSWGLVFTCGVLDHLPKEEFDLAIEELQRITQNYVYCIETNDTPAEYFYPHDYKAKGFTNKGEYKTPNGTYILWGKQC